MNEKSLILYHYPCADGVFAALAAKLSNVGQWFEFIPHSTTKTLSVTELAKQTKHAIYLLDYCGPRGFIQECCDHFRVVFLIDHHKTAQDELDRMDVYPNNLVFRVDQFHSGCYLAFDWFQYTEQTKQTILTEDLLTMFRYVEDHDMYWHRMPQSEEFTEGLASLNLDYGSHDIFDRLVKLDTKSSS